jgi:hypothetical protein
VFKKISQEIRISSSIPISNHSLDIQHIEMTLSKKDQILMLNQKKRLLIFQEGINLIHQLLMEIVLKKKDFARFQVLNLLRNYLLKVRMTLCHCISNNLVQKRFLKYAQFTYFQNIQNKSNTQIST